MAHRILVTGATGTVGSEVLRALSGGEHQVRVAARGEKATDLQAAGYETVEMDFRRPESLVAALQGVDRALLLTPLTPDMVELGKAFVTAAKLAGVKHIVRLSGAGAETKGITLARWHREVEEAIEASGIAYTHVRPTSFMQNYVKYMGHLIKTKGAYYLPHGTGKVSRVDARDVAAVVVAALTKDGHEGQAYALTGPEAISDYDVAEILSSTLGRPVSYVDVPEEAARQSMLEAGMPAVLVDVMVELYRIEREGWVSTVSPVVEQITGRPARTFAAFAQDYATAFK